MDGTLAFLFLALSLTEMGGNPCPTGCIGRQDVQSRLAFATGPTVFRTESVGQEFHWTQQFHDDRAFVQAHLTPGLYAQGEGIDLGHPVEFRSGIGVCFEANNGWRWSLGIDHRSNTDQAEGNPGLETVQVRLGLPLT